MQHSLPSPLHPAVIFASHPTHAPTRAVSCFRVGPDISGGAVHRHAGRMGGLHVWGAHGGMHHQHAACKIGTVGGALRIQAFGGGVGRGVARWHAPTAGSLGKAARWVQRCSMSVWVGRHTVGKVLQELGRVKRHAVA